ncbi:MAG: hypothetical protein AB7U82_16265 [Blastocatellales bacterium]
MADWYFAQTDPSEELAQLHHFSMKKRQPSGDVEFIITVREYVNRNQQYMRFYAEADKQVNQKMAPFTPFGWGETLLSALCECKKAIQSYPYEGAGG